MRGLVGVLVGAFCGEGGRDYRLEINRGGRARVERSKEEIR